MGWGIIIKNVELRRVHKCELAESLEEREEAIRHCREKLLMLAASHPAPVEDGESNTMPWVDWVHYEINQLLADYEDAVREAHLIRVALDDPSEVEDW